VATAVKTNSYCCGYAYTAELFSKTPRWARDEKVRCWYSVEMCTLVRICSAGIRREQYYVCGYRPTCQRVMISSNSPRRTQYVGTHIPQERATNNRSREKEAGAWHGTGTYACHLISTLSCGHPCRSLLLAILILLNDTRRRQSLLCSIVGFLPVGVGLSNSSDGRRRIFRTPWSRFASVQLLARPLCHLYAGHGSRSPTGLATTWQTGFSFRGSFRRCGFAVGNLGFSHPCGLMILIDRQIRSVSRVFLVSHQSNRACGTRHLALAQLFGFIGGLMSG
jgi:hypothetical protein